MVQRLLAARSLSHARAGCLLAGALKLLPIWVVLLGMVARVLYTGFYDELVMWHAGIYLINTFVRLSRLT